MSNIFSLLSQPPRAPVPTVTPQTTTPPAPASIPAGIGSDPSPSNPTPSTYNPEPWSLPVLPGTAASSNPVLLLYSRRLSAQTEALYSLLQTSLTEIKEQQEGLVKLLGQGERQVKVLEGKVGEVVGKVGGEVDQTLIQLRSILSTTNSVLLAIDAKLLESESGSDSLLRRVDRIENILETAVAGVKRVERVLFGMQDMEKRLIDRIFQIRRDIGFYRNFREYNESSRDVNPDRGRREEGVGKEQQKRAREESLEIPCSWAVDKIADVESAGQEEEEDESMPMPEPEPISKPVPKRRRLMSDNEIIEMELEAIKQIRAGQAEGHAYSGQPATFGEGAGELEENMDETGRIVEESVVAPATKKIHSGEVSGVRTRAMAMAMGMKKRVLLTTQELMEGTLL